MAESDPQSDKRRLRLEMRARLAGETAASSLEAGRALAGRLGNLDVWRRAARVGLFVSRPDEIDTAPLARCVLGAGKALLLPRVTRERRLEFAPIDDLERLEPGPYGILEPPPECSVTCPAPEDLLCVPGLAFDRSGGRLGRGGGYYDRTFAAMRHDLHRCRFVGIGFSFQLIAQVPMTDRDLRLDGVVTDRETVELDTGSSGRARSTGGRKAR